MTPDPAIYPYRVRYYDRVLSHKGQGVQCRVFRTREDAESFAGQNKLYAKPCRAEERAPAATEQWDST